jgi:predicted nucleic acid-binding protein
MSSPAAPIKVVFDCMIFLQAAANDEGPAATALDLVDTGEIKLYVSEQVLEEVRNVLNRIEVRAALHKSPTFVWKRCFGGWAQRARW